MEMWLQEAKCYYVPAVSPESCSIPMVMVVSNVALLSKTTKAIKLTVISVPSMASTEAIKLYVARETMGTKRIDCE